MQCSQMRLSVPYLPHSRAPNILLFPLFDYVVDHTHFRSSAMLSTCQKLHRVEALQMSVDVGEISTSKASIDSLEEAHGDGYIDSRETEKQKNMGQWMKGNLPWNKGLAHSEETRKWISERTKEALRDPKVKQKMREHPRPHSDQTKAKIGSTQRKLWEKRLKVKRQKEKFLSLWAESIAEIAKKGGRGEEELEWDSYDKILDEMILLEIKKAEEKRNAKEKAKEKLRMRAEAAQAKAEAARLKAKEMAQNMTERMKILAQKRIEREKKAKTRVKRPRRSKETKEELAAAQERKLKQNLEKIRKRKGKNGLARGGVSEIVPQLTALEKLDLELIMKEKARKEVSLADQLRAAKSKRVEHGTAT